MDFWQHQTHQQPHGLVSTVPNGHIGRYDVNRGDSSESPLFERQMGSDEYMELQQLRTATDNLQARISGLEKINIDLEDRLEDQAKQSMAVEKECMLIEQRWAAKKEIFVNEIEKWKQSFQIEKSKGDKLREQIHRSEKELYGILQRKHELMKGPVLKARMPEQTRRSDFSDSFQQRGDIDIVTGYPKKDPKSSKEREVLSNLSDFLGF